MGKKRGSEQIWIFIRYGGSDTNLICCRAVCGRAVCIQVCAGTAPVGRFGGNAGSVFADFLCEYGSATDFKDWHTVYASRKEWKD